MNVKPIKSDKDYRNALKRSWGFTFTLMKGKENVLSEANMMMISYNFRRLMSIFGATELKNRLKNYCPAYLPK